jgi:ketosteroid isomerase-like protein
MTECRLKEGLMSSMEYAVVQAVEDLTTAFQKSDLDGVMSAYERTAAIAFEPGQAVRDEDRIREMFAQWFALEPRFEYAGHDVLVAGDLALHVAPWHMRGTLPDGEPVEREGLSIAVLRRAPSGGWRIVIDNPHGQRLLTLAEAR